MAKSYGRVLARDIALKDSLLTIRKQTIQILQTEAISLSQENKMLLSSNLLLSNKVRKNRNRKNIAIGLSLGLVLLLVL